MGMKPATAGVPLMLPEPRFENISAKQTGNCYLFTAAGFLGAYSKGDMHHV